MTITKALPSDAGCYVEGWWGQYAGAHMVMRATEFGYSDAEVIALARKKLDEMFPTSGEQLSDDEYEILSDMIEDVETWLNYNVAPALYLFGWYEGEFYLWTEKQWEES